jgi:hypothetical protein
MKTFALWVVITGVLSYIVWYLIRKDDKSVTLQFKNWEDARWVVNNAMASIDQAYEKGSVRHEEMKALHKELSQQLRMQVGEEYDT